MCMKKHNEIIWVCNYCKHVNDKRFKICELCRQDKGKARLINVDEIVSNKAHHEINIKNVAKMSSNYSDNQTPINTKNNKTLILFAVLLIIVVVGYNVASWLNRHKSDVKESVNYELLVECLEGRIVSYSYNTDIILSKDNIKSTSIIDNKITRKGLTSYYVDLELEVEISINEDRMYIPLKLDLIYGNNGYLENVDRVNSKWVVDYCAPNGDATYEYASNGVEENYEDFAYADEEGDFSHTGKIELFGDLGTDFYNLVDEIGDLKSTGASEGTEYSNERIIIWSEAFNGESGVVRSIMIVDDSDYSIQGICYGMNVQLAMEFLSDEGWQPIDTEYEEWISLDGLYYINIRWDEEDSIDWISCRMQNY